MGQPPPPETIATMPSWKPPSVSLPPQAALPRAPAALPRTAALPRVAAALFLLAACADERIGSNPTDSWQATHDTIGDTVVVHTVAGSVWGEPRTLVEDLAIGTLDGADEYMFGRVHEVAPDDSGGVYVFDGQVPALRYYDAAGAHVRTLGGEGSGPGEYRDQALGLAVRRDGRLVLRDPRNARLTIYEPDGTPSDHIPVASGLFTGNALVLDTADHMYLAVLTGETERNRPWPIGYLHLDDTGAIVDTIRPPSIAGEPTEAAWMWGANKEWVLAPDRSIVVGLTDRIALEVRRPDGSVVRIQRDHDRIAPLPEERAEREALNDWYRRNQAANLTTEIGAVPDLKPAWRSLNVADDGSIWVRLHTTAQRLGELSDDPNPNRPPPLTWVEPSVFDVFRPDGTYLGEVRMPPRTRIAAIRNDVVWGIRVGEFNEQYVVRLRMREPVAAIE